MPFRNAWLYVLALLALTFVAFWPSYLSDLPAAKRIERVLWNDPATGVMRHADAGYEDARACAREQALNLPMLGR